jgi:large subunit ribosomal protein L15
MVDLKILQRSKTKPKKRVGRGAGSGRGKTSGRGQKGQKARGKVRLGFEGGQRPLIKRLPYRRGKGNYKLSKKPIIVNLKVLNLLESGIVVDLDVLVKKGIVEKESAQKFGVKILGDGKLSIPLKINLPVSKRAIVKIEKAGGKVIFGKNNEGITEKVGKSKSSKKVKK